METIVEKDSPVTALTLLAIIILLFVGGIFGLVYLGGVFTGKNQVIENDKRIESLNLAKSPSPTASRTAKP